LIFEHTSPLTLFFKVMILPFLFLWDTASNYWGWGPDCANPISASDRNDDDDFQVLSVTLLLLFASVFGGLHFMTWSFSMPTVTELWMWRSASIALVSIPILLPLCAVVGNSLERFSDFMGAPVAILMALLLILHPMIRLIIAVDSVVLLRSLPDTAFLVLSWSDAIPFL